MVSDKVGAKFLDILAYLRHDLPLESTEDQVWLDVRKFTHAILGKILLGALAEPTRFLVIFRRTGLRDATTVTFGAIVVLVQTIGLNLVRMAG